MARYIDAEQAIRLIEHDNLLQVYYSKSDAIDCINATPTADVQAVRHGKWITKDLTPYCSVCHRPSEYECDGVHSKPLFCPHCGAKMDGKEKGR